MSTFFEKRFRRNAVDTELLKQAIAEYRADGKRLMEELGKKYGLDIHLEDDYNQLIRKSNKNIPRTGELSKQWSYAFHGGDCGFYNRKYRQSVEVSLDNAPEFDTIDPWFLMCYLRSTDKYKVIEIEWTDLPPIIHQLLKRGELK